MKFLQIILRFILRLKIDGCLEINKISDASSFLILPEISGKIILKLIAAFSYRCVLLVPCEKKTWGMKCLKLMGVLELITLDFKNFEKTHDISKRMQKTGHFIVCPALYDNYPKILVYRFIAKIMRAQSLPLIPVKIDNTEVQFLPMQVSKVTTRACVRQLLECIGELKFISKDYQKTLWQALIERWREEGNQRVCMQDMKSGKFTYFKLILSSVIMGKCIAKHTKPDESVGILLPTLSITAIIFFGLQAIHRLPVMLNFSMGRERLMTACRIAKVKQIYTSRLFIEMMKFTSYVEALESMGISVFYVEGLKSQVTFSHKLLGLYTSLKIRFLGESSWKQAQSFSKKAAVILFTSGSENLPKGVLLSHQNILSNGLQMASCIDFIHEDYLFNTLPLFHCFGLTVGLLLPILHGFPVFLYPSPLQYREIPEWIAKTKATFFLSTDTFLNGYARFATKAQFKTVRCIFAGAERVKEETIQQWKKQLGQKIFEGYGVTEASPVISVNHSILHQYGSVGCLVPQLQYRFTTVEGIDIPCVEGGRLWVSGPNIMMGYLNEDGFDALKDGWYDTGDIACLEKGFLKILGRAKRFAKIAGEMVSLTFVEQMVTSLWNEALHAVVSVKDSKKGEQLVLFTTQADISLQVMLNHFKLQGYSELYMPKKWRIVEELPVLASGKIDYVTLQDSLNIDTV